MLRSPSAHSCSGLSALSLHDFSYKLQIFATAHMPATSANAAHAEAIRSMFVSQLSYMPLEQKLSALSDIVEMADVHGFAVLDISKATGRLIFGGSAEAEEVAHEERQPHLDPKAGLNTALEGEVGSIMDSSGLDDHVAAALHCATGKYCMLFNKPLLALGSFRAARQISSSDCSAAEGMASCLDLLGQEAAAAHLTLHFWVNEEPLLSEVDAGAFLYTLADAWPNPPAEAQLILRKAIGFLGTGSAAAAARSLGRRWLPEMLGLDQPGSGAPKFLSLIGAPDSWLGQALRSSCLFACAALEPIVRAARRVILTVAINTQEDSDPSRCEALATAAASIACHMHAIGFCVPEDAEETRDIETACKALVDGDSGARLRAAAAEAAVESSEAPGALPASDVALLMTVAMYRPLAEVAASSALHQLRASHLAAAPTASEAIDEHLRKPRARAKRAVDLPAVTPVDAASSHVESFYRTTLYPQWHVPETLGSPSSTVRQRLHRHYPWLDWPFEEAETMRICLAGSGSGHQAAHTALTLPGCRILALDLSATSLAYGEQQMALLLPASAASRVTHVVGDVMLLGSVGRDAAGTADAATTLESYKRHIAAKFHFVISFGVIHHCTDPSSALKQLVENTLLPGGVLQIGTYSARSVDSWLPHARWLLNRIAPNVVSASGALVRQPMPDELRAIRGRILELASATEKADVDDGDGDEQGRVTARQIRSRLAAISGAAGDAEREKATARTLSLFEEFYYGGGVLDLIFHPQETAFTLMQLHEMIGAIAGLEVIGVSFLSAAADRHARAKFRSAQDGKMLEEDPQMRDLRNWDELEKLYPQMFGRMHVVYCQLKARADDE